MKILKRRNELSVICSHICHNGSPQYVYQLETQSVKVWRRYSTSDMNSYQSCVKIDKNAINQKVFYNLRWHLACWYVYWLDIQSVKVLSRCNTSNIEGRYLCVKILKKHNKIRHRSITLVYIWLVNISKYVYYLDTHSVKVWWRYVLPNWNVAHFCDIIFIHKNTAK